MLKIKDHKSQKEQKEMAKDKKKGMEQNGKHYKIHKDFNENVIMRHLQGKYKDKHPINLFFNIFAKRVSDIVGNAWSFFVASLIIVIWALSGHFYQYSDTWQLVINTGTTIVTFLIVFLIQNTQNRDMEILNLKIDELIIAKKGARNHMINLENLSDIELKELEKEYIKLTNKRVNK